MSIIPVAIAITSLIIFELVVPNSIIERQIFSVTTAVKKGNTAVNNIIVFLLVHLEAKHESPEINKKAGIKMLEKP